VGQISGDAGDELFLGAAHSSDEQTAQQAIDKLAQLRDETAENSGYWAQQVEVQRLSAQAWLDYLQGHKDEGLKTMREAAELEASTDKHPVTPGEVLPAHELLGDMLLDMGRYDEAYSACQDSLERNANRFHSLYGAGHAAELGGDEASARRYYEKLSDITVADSERAALSQVRAFLDDSIAQSN
jgi:tetratricopeptide (TPR) repeat protein